MKQDKHLDEQIRKALESLEASNDSHAWDSFEQKLEAAELENNDWDAALRQRLTGLEAPVLAGDWSFMANRLDAEDTAELIENEAALDNLAYEKLSNLSARYQSAHWRLMAQRIEKEFSLRHTLYKYKVMEAALLLLLLLTIVRVAPLADDFFRQKEAVEPTRQIQAAPAAAAQQPDAQASNQTEQNAAADPAATKSLPVQANALAQGDPLSDANPPAGTSKPSGISGKPGSKNSALTQSSGNGNGNGLTGGSAGATLPGKIASAGLPFPQLDEVKSLAEQAPQFEKMRLLDNRLFAEANTPGQIESPKSNPVVSHFGWETPAVVAHPFIKNNKQLRFTILTTSDLNYVSTPPDQFSISDTLVTTDANLSAASGYGGGILVSLKSNRLEFQTGGVYSFKRYMPGTSDFLWESVKYYVKEGFDGIQLDIFQMPLNVQYHFKNTGKWRMYASSGVSGHVVTSSVHEFGKPKAQPL
ncbi:MAG: hypothetical protein AAB316_20020, partial [Bacteroidota bacterium]